ncbi:DNAse I-like superfamily protein, partial [Striga hermonthica]
WLLNARNRSLHKESRLPKPSRLIYGHSTTPPSPSSTNVRGKFTPGSPRKEVLKSKTLDFSLLSDLGVLETVEQYLTTLHLWRYADVFHPTYRNLTLEFFSTLEFRPNASGSDSLTFRMLGTRRVIGNKSLETVLGLTDDGFSTVFGMSMASFWPELSPDTVWDPQGMPNSLIEHGAIAIMHKFLCYGLLGKKEANKVTQVDLSVLWAMIGRADLNVRKYLKEEFRAVLRNKRAAACFGHVVTAFALNLGVDPTASGSPPVQMRRIDVFELHHSGLIFDRRTFVVYEQRQDYSTYMRKLEAAASAAQTSSSRPQQATDDTHQADEMDHDQTVLDDSRLLLPPSGWQPAPKPDIQLNKEREAGRVFIGWSEGKIVFAPTYKYSHNSDSYAGETTKSKKKRRTPA